MSNQVRLRCEFHGRVQGVGFRFTTVHLAAGFRVTGFVRNLANGGVELVAEGEKTEVQRFVAALRARMAGYIHRAEETWGPATGEFSGFRIAH